MVEPNDGAERLPALVGFIHNSGMPTYHSHMSVNYEK